MHVITLLAAFTTSSKPPNAGLHALPTKHQSSGLTFKIKANGCTRLQANAMPPETSRTLTQKFCTQVVVGIGSVQRDQKVSETEFALQALQDPASSSS